MAAISSQIDAFIAGDYACSSAREYERYLEQLRGPVKQMNLALKELKSDHDQQAIDLRISEGRVNTLLDENEAKTQSLDWINQILKVGNSKELPRAWMSEDAHKSYEQLQKNDYFKAQMDQLQTEGIIEKILEDIEMSKAFSVIVDSLLDVLDSVGLLR